MRKNRNKVFIILYFSATRSQHRAEKHQRAVDPLPAGQTFDFTNHLPLTASDLSLSYLFKTQEGS